MITARTGMESVVKLYLLGLDTWNNDGLNYIMQDSSGRKEP